jgi:hypothetical protein
VYTRKGIKGSNPFLSAIQKSPPFGGLFFLLASVQTFCGVIMALTIPSATVTSKSSKEGRVPRSRGPAFHFARAALAAALFCAPVFSQNGVVGGKLNYRGFTVDLSASQSAPNLQAIEASLEHQIDIAADCGAKPAVLAFFRSQEIVLKPGQGDGGGHFAAGSRGIVVDAAVDPPEKPIILHELMHAYHWRVLPGRFKNPDVLLYYSRAKDNGLYPPGSYVLKNPEEFFAVTASLYLWGYVARPPFNRVNLKAQQPYYYAWLGRQFGVRK